MNTLICSSKAPTELRRLSNYSLDKNRKKEINIGIKIKMNHTHSEILNYISRNFGSIF